MEPVSSNLSSLVPVDQLLPSVNFNPSLSGSFKNNALMNDAACSFMPAFNGLSDFVLNKFASFNDLLTVSMGGLSQMQKQAESIRDLVTQAKEEGVTPELMDKIQAEVDSRVAEINRIRDNTVFNGINPFNGSFSLDIPDILGMLNAGSKEEASNAISEMLGTFDIDFSIEGDGFSFGGSAKIEIGYTDDGALQINVEASMDYDLSGLVNNGVSSDEAFDIINNFISMLGVQQGDLGNAQNFMDALFEQLFNIADKSASFPEDSEASSLTGQIIQQASITVDNPGQMPGISLNIL